MYQGGVKSALAAILALAAAACSLPGSVSATHTPLISSSIATRAFSLLTNNHLLVADLNTAAVLAELTLGGPSAPQSQMRAMAVSPDGHTLYAVVSEAGGRARIAVIDTATLRLTTSIDLGSEFVYRGLAMGPRTGRLYLFANQSGDAVVQVIDPSAAQSPQTWPARKAEGRTWFIYQGAVSPDETTLYLSYHGPDTTGMDRFAIQPTGLLRCSMTTRPESGCFLTHGPFAVDDGVLLASMAEQPLAALDPLTGARRNEYNLQLDGNHMLEITVASAIRRIYAVGSCGYTGGLSMVDLSTSQTQVLVASRSVDAICGERIVSRDDGSLLVVAKTAVSVPYLVPGALIVLSKDGTFLRMIPTSAESMDLLLF
jgi:hypothetical protein